MPARGPEASQRMSLAIFIRAAPSILSAPGGEDEVVVRRKRRELVRMRTERQAGEFGNLLGGALAELGMRVETGTDGGAADGQIVEVVQRFLDRDHRTVELGDVARELLAERQRGRVLKMRASDFDDVIPLLAFASSASRSFSTAGSMPTIASAAAMCMAVGNVSFEDCDMLT